MRGRCGVCGEGGRRGVCEARFTAVYASAIFGHHRLPHPPAARSPPSARRYGGGDRLLEPPHALPPSRARCRSPIACAAALARPVGASGELRRVWIGVFWGCVRGLLGCRLCWSPTDRLEDDLAKPGARARGHRQLAVRGEPRRPLSVPRCGRHATSGRAFQGCQRGDWDSVEQRRVAEEGWRVCCARMCAHECVCARA